MDSGAKDEHVSEVPPVEQQISDMLPRKAWDRLSDETVRAFAAFKRYRDLPPEVRTIRKAAEAHRAATKAKTLPSLKTIERRFEKWSSDHYWRARTAQYDDALLAVEHEGAVEARREMGRKHAQLADALVKTAIEALAKVKPEELSPQEIARFADVGVKLGRLVHGDSTGEDGSGAPDFVAPQDLILDMLTSDPEVAKAGAKLGAQLLRVKRERADDTREREE